MSRRTIRTTLRRALIVVALVVMGLLGGGASALAATSIPASTSLPSFLNFCEPEAPPAEVPGTGIIGWLDTRPETISTELTKDTIWSNGGLTGMHSHVYDLGCTANPAALVNIAYAKMENQQTNALVDAGFVASALTFSAERNAWDPTWIGAFLSNFVTHAVSVVSAQVWGPFIAIGLIVTSAFLVYSARAGSVGAVANGVAWTFLVLGVAGAVLLSPLAASEGTQRLGSNVVTTLNQGVSNDVAASNADAITGAVHYQDYLRRTFGSHRSEQAEQYGLRLLAASRLSWAEADQVGNDPAAMDAMRERKAADWNAVAAEIKAADEDGAYRSLQGDPSANSSGALGLAFALAVNLFRFMALLVMIGGILMLAALGVVWLCASPYIVTPPGVSLGRGLLSNAGMAFGHVVTCAVGVWLFILYARVALAPGVSSGWSLILLIVGSIMFWTIIRPDRKLFSLMTLGRVNGSGKTSRKLFGLIKGLAISVAAGATAGTAAGAAVAAASAGGGDKQQRSHERWDTPPPPPPMHALTGPAAHSGTIVDHPAPAARWDEEPPPPSPSTEHDYVQGEVLYRRDEGSHGYDNEGRDR